MSHAFYNAQWQAAMEELNEQIEIENPPPEYDDDGKLIPRPQITWDDAFQHYACLYIRYIQIFRKLEDCYDQIVHPQKRRDIKVVLESVMARVCQIKQELVRFGQDGKQSDYLNLDELLLDLKLSPDSLEIPIPRYFRERNRDDDEENKKREILEKCLEEHGMAGGAMYDEPGSLMTKMSKEQAIRIIQKNERGRQGAVRAKLMKELKEEDMLRRRLAAAGQHDRDPTSAATLIQKSFRGHLSRIRTRKLAQEELVFIKMRTASEREKVDKTGYAPLAKEKQIRRNRKIRQADNELKYIEALAELKQIVHDSEGPEMKDQMWDERYNWWINQREKSKNGKFPTSFDQFYKEKAEEEARRNIDPEEEAKKKAAEEEKNNSKKRGGRSAPAPKRGGKKNAKQEEIDAMLNKTVEITPGPLVSHMVECVAKYKGVWANIQEEENYHQTHDESIARDKLRPIAKEKIRKEVDIRLLAYLENIKNKVAAMSKKKKKGKRGKKKGGKKKGGRKKKGKGKKGKKKKKKKCCDGEKSCIHMPLGDMVSVLVKMSILQELRKPAKQVEDYKGGMNYLGAAYQAAGVVLDASMCQIRQCITEYCILPLGSPYVKTHSPLLNAVLLYGPHGSGKTLLSRAIAAETSATWFDLSPRNVAAKLGTKSEIAKLVHMVFKVATELQPSVIYIDDVDKVWLGSKSKKHAADIIKMKNYIMQHKKMLTNDKRILVIGNSRAPYADKVDRKELNKFFSYKNSGKMIFLPCPNYATRLDLWRHFISETGLDVVELEKDEKFDLTTIACISEGFSAGNIQQAVEATLPPRRVQKILQSNRAFDSAEFISALSKTSYTYRDDYNAFRKFTDEVTGEKERRRLKEAALKAAAEAAEAEKKKGGKRRR